MIVEAVLWIFFAVFSFAIFGAFSVGREAQPGSKEADEAQHRTVWYAIMLSMTVLAILNLHYSD